MELPVIAEVVFVLFLGLTEPSPSCRDLVAVADVGQTYFQCTSPRSFSNIQCRAGSSVEYNGELAGSTDLSTSPGYRRGLREVEKRNSS